MADEELKDYLGIPRLEIPWYPMIDKGACSDCGVCVKACKHGTYAEVDGSVVVLNPYHCEVYCESCRFACPEGAISFPNRKEFRQILRDLHKIYPLAE